MLATVGLVVPEFVRIPGSQFSFEAVPNVLDAHDALLDTSMKQILIWVSLAEVCTLGALSNMNEFDRAPGDFGFDPMGFYPTDPAKQREMKLKELKNGRLVSLHCSCSLFLTVSNRAFPNSYSTFHHIILLKQKAMVALGGMIHGAIVSGHGFPYL